MPTEPTTFGERVLRIVENRCPTCGNRVPAVGEKRRRGETFCTPLTCSAWIEESEDDLHPYEAPDA
jgi:hypothetical protein